MTDLVVAPCSHAAASYAVEHWHYSRRMPVGPWVLYGAWEAGVYIGAVVFSRGASPHLLTAYGLDTTQGAELTRVALRAHAAPVSQIVSAAVKLLKRSNPGLRLLVSFADPFHGHRGGIYQAMGWTYAGTTASATAYRDARGRLLHQRVVSTSGVVTQFGKRTRVPPKSSLSPVTLPGKHRYLLPLDRATRKRVARLARPYPTRARSVDGDAPGSRPGEASSTLAERSGFPPHSSEPPAS